MMASRSSSRSANGHIDKLDFDSHRNLRSINGDAEETEPSGLLRDDESLLSDIVEGVIKRDRRVLGLELTKYLSFASAVLNCLCAGSITAYSLYGHLFLSHLHYTQYEVNAVSTAAELAMYLPVPLVGYLCDRYNPRPLSLAAAFFFGVGYLVAAFTYRKGPKGWPFEVMILAFAGIGIGTSCMVFSAVTTCAKNFARGKHKGLALAIPLAAFGLSGMWQSQVGIHLLYKREGDGKGDVDVYRFFLFLAGTLFAAGIVGAFGLRIVAEEDLIDEAVEELERGGLLDENDSLFHHSAHHAAHHPTHHPAHHFTHHHSMTNTTNYGTISPRSSSTTSSLQLTPSALKGQQHEEEVHKKTLLLDDSTYRFRTDPTMWLLASGFFLVTGPGEAFINNLGTIIPTLYPPPFDPPPSNSAATHVSIIALTSTFARLLTGTLTDLLAPTASLISHQTGHPDPNNPKRFTISRLTFLIASTLVLAISQLLLASSLIQNHPPLFPLVSALVGLGYGAIFSLTPIIISVVWGVQNFGTNWGIIAMVPAGGAAVWSAIYSAVYTRGVVGDGEACFGEPCYRGTFWGMLGCSILAMGLFAGAWRVWRSRGVAI